MRARMCAQKRSVASGDALTGRAADALAQLRANSFFPVHEHSQACQLDDEAARQDWAGLESHDLGKGRGMVVVWGGESRRAVLREHSHASIASSAIRPVVRLRSHNKRLQKWSRSPFRAGQLPPSMIPIALAALFSTFAVQPAGNGWLFDPTTDTAAHAPSFTMQCPLQQVNNSSAWQNFKTGEQYARHDRHTQESDWRDLDDMEEEDLLDAGSWQWHTTHAKREAAPQSLLLNPDFVALLVRTVLILLEFGSRPLKNAKKMLSCGLLCYWLYHYRFGSEASILANRCTCNK